MNETIAVVGAGISGLLVARALQARGCAIEHVEARPAQLGAAHKVDQAQALAQGLGHGGLAAAGGPDERGDPLLRDAQADPRQRLGGAPSQRLSSAD